MTLTSILLLLLQDHKKKKWHSRIEKKFSHIRYVAPSLTLRRSVMHTGQLFPAVCFWKNLIPDAVKYWFSLTSVKALIFLLWLNNLSNKIFFAFLGFHKLSHTHTFLSHCRVFVHAFLLYPSYGSCCQIAWAWIGFIMATRGATMVSWKLTRQLFLWLRLLFVERVEKWRSPRARWKNRENFLASANKMQATFLLFTKRFLIQEMLDCIVYNSFDVRVIR